MNVRSLLSLTLSALIIMLPACCWRNKKCCYRQDPVATETKNKSPENNDKGVTKF